MTFVSDIVTRSTASLARPGRRDRIRRRAGVTRGDVVVVVILVGITFLLVVMGMTRSRENARVVFCNRNLARIGFGLSLYDQMHGELPTTGTTPLDVPSSKGPPGPLKALLRSLDLPDLTELKDARTPPTGRGGSVPGEIPIPGFTCPGDPETLAGRLPAPVSYRAVTGDTAAGDNGPFAPGRAWSLAAIEQRDGTAYTAAFSERLVGAGEERVASLRSYRVAGSPLPSTGCPPGEDPATLHGDAGASWIAADYRSTLYNHALTPNGRPSCIATDGRTAYMGASSGHVRGVNLLRLDGSVTTIPPTIAPKVWREYASISPLPQSDTP